jgi:hypothetical protein
MRQNFDIPILPTFVPITVLLLSFLNLFFIIPKAYAKKRKSNKK